MTYSPEEDPITSGANARNQTAIDRKNGAVSSGSATLI